jgi:hypothetical protein
MYKPHVKIECNWMVQLKNLRGYITSFFWEGQGVGGACIGTSGI